MLPKVLLLGVTILSIVIIVSGVAYTLVQSQLQAAPSTSGNGEQTPIGDTTPEVQPEYPDTSSGDVVPGDSTTTNTSDVNASDNPFLSGASSPQGQIRDQGMAYLKSNQADTAPLMTNLAWTGGRDDSAPAGTERYLFYANNTWAVTVENLITSASSYTIIGNYNSPTRAFSFNETYTNGVFNLKYAPYPVQPPPLQP